MAETELLPCPFCGGSASIIPSYDSRRIACRNKDCFGPETSFFELETEAIAAWNRRASRPPGPSIAVLVEALRHLPDIAENFMLRFNVHDMPEDKAQQWQALEHEIANARAALSAIEASR